MELITQDQMVSTERMDTRNSYEWMVKPLLHFYSDSLGLHAISNHQESRTSSDDAVVALVLALDKDYPI